VAGTLLLLACAAGGAVGARAILLHLRSADSPASADRPAPRSSHNTAQPGRAPQVPPPSSPTPRPEVLLPPRPKPMARPVLTLPETSRRAPLGDVDNADPTRVRPERQREQERGREREHD